MTAWGPDCVKTPIREIARRISISISSISESIALAASFGRRQLRKQFCASVAQVRFHTAWVNRRNTHRWKNLIAL